MLRFQNLSIAGKAYFLFFVMLLLVTVVSGSLINVLKETDAAYAAMGDNEAHAAVEEMRIRGDLQNYGRQMNNVLLVQHPPAGLDEIEVSLADLMSKIRRSMAAIGKTTCGADILKELEIDLPKIKAVEAATIAMKRSGDPDQDQKARALWSAHDGRPLVVELYDHIASSADSELKQFDAMSDAYTNRTNSTCLFAVIAIAVGLLLSGLLAYLIASVSIARPLKVLQQTMRLLAGQNFSVDVPFISRSDEVGSMAQTVQIFKDNGLRTAVLNANESHFVRSAAETESNLPHVVGSLILSHEISYFCSCGATRSLIRQWGERRRATDWEVG